MNNKYPKLNKLKGKIRENGESYRSIGEKIGMGVNTLNNKLNGYSPFNVEEAIALCDVLNIEYNEIPIFFNLSVAV